MARLSAPQKRGLIAIGSVVVGAIFATAAIIWPGYDEQQTPVQTASVWALQTSDGTRYARVNTELGELDTVRSVENPSQLVQSDTQVLVYTQANAAFAHINLAQPQNLDEPDTEALTRTPPGTVSVHSAGAHIAYLTDTGQVFIAPLDDPKASPVQIEFVGAQTAATDALAIDAEGTLAAYSASRGTVQIVDAATGEVKSEDALTDAPEAGGLQLTLISGSWFLLDTATAQLWSSASDTAVAIDVDAQARIQQPSVTGDVVYVADSQGLWSFSSGEEQPTRILSSAEASGAPAAPVAVNDEVYAAWLADGTSAGVMWSSAEGSRALSYGSADIGDSPLPEFQVSGTRAILNDTSSGWVWRVPNGDLIESSQAWVSDEVDAQAETPDEQQAEQLIEPKPPVAVDDAFGVRANSQIALQVMLNDSDPNEDVLSIVPDSLSGLRTDFGTLALGENNQQIILTVAASAAGTATFTYRVTDGTSADGLNSNVASVTLTLVPENTNRAPVWCGVDGCLLEWPSPEVAPGQTVVTEVLAGWVDPDGDPIYLASAQNSESAGTVTFNPAGMVTYQHPNPNQETDSAVPVTVTISDDRGASAEKQLTIGVTSRPTLVTKSFATTGVVGQKLTVSPLHHVTGVSGSAQLSAVESLDTQRAKATLNSNAASFEFMADEPGSYLVRYTVRDAISERTGLVRVLMQKADLALFAAAPLTVFVWPQQDATVDLLSGVTNATGRVLLISDVQPNPVSNASLSIDLVAQQYLRVSGGSDSGASQLLGHVQYEVVDSASTQRSLGLVTVMLMPQPEPATPIAVDDRITVRAGAQVDIPVLENDAPVAGTTLTLNPATVSNTDSKSLAFASGRLIRYLAPQQAGTYQVGYSVSTSGYPNLSDTATITVTVLGNEANRKPQPRALTGRVLSGNTVRIPFDSFGIDPDGDSVVLDQILSQPDSGTAAISADGNAIEFTSAIDSAGQVQFDYQVRDTLGEVGAATVSVGVRDAQIDPRPVVFTDTVQVQIGESNTIVVEPLANDIDPSGSPLTLTRVAPNAPEGSAEWRTLAERIAQVGKQKVVFNAGSSLGTSSFTYTVENESGDTSIGLIVVHTIRDALVDAPVVTDTILDLETREKFPRGVDVVTGKVSWATGKVSDLTLSLWGKPTDIAVRDWSISGPLPKQSRIIPFKVSGVGSDGEEIASFGFLRVPGEDDLRLALRANLPELTVNEGEKLDFDMSKLVLAPDDALLKVLDSGVKSSGVRESSTCELVSSTTIRYTAGKGSPWHDSCTVPIRLATQSVYTYLTVPISIDADEPQPELNPAAVTVSPGESLSFDLTQMIEWTGGEDWAALALAVAPGGSDFATELSGTTLTITGSDRVKPGMQQSAVVTVTSHQDVTPATLTIRAGPAPSELPQGATLTKQCSQADGQSCEITVIAAAGEVNPLPNTALELVSVDSPEMCPNVTFEVTSSSTVRASWTDAAVGAQCTANFIVKDAQGRQSLGDRMGALTLDLLGYPQAPASVNLSSYGDRTVTLSVSPGSASNAYPALEGFVILRDGQEVSSCGPSGNDCTAITGLTNGERVQFEAKSVNAVGQSKLENPTLTTWAYRVPTIDSATATPIYVAGQTTQTQGVVEVIINTDDSEVRAFTVTGANGEVTRTGSRTSVTVELPVSTSTITVTPLSEFDAPDGGSSAGSSVNIGVAVAGLPLAGPLTLASVGSNSITATELEVNANGSNKSIEKLYVAYQAGGSAVCQVGSTGAGLTATVINGRQSSTPTISGLDSNVRYTVKACASNGFGVVESEAFTAIPFAAPNAPAGYTYSIRDGSADGNYLIQLQEGSAAPAGFAAVYSGDDVFGSTLNVTVKFCLAQDLTMCSAEAQVQPEDANATVQFRVSVNAATSCAVGAALSLALDADGVAGEVVTVSTQDGGGTWTDLANLTDPIPEGAIHVQATYQWTAVGTTALQPYRAKCTP